MQNRNLRFTKIGFAIEKEIDRNYTVRAHILKIGGRESNTYDVTLELRRSDIGKWDMLDEEHYSITSENINMCVCEFIMDKFDNGFFKRFIDRYEYDLKCFDKGNAVFCGEDDE